MKLSELPDLTPSGTIIFFFNDVEVGRTGLPEKTDRECRNELAKQIGVKKYNNYHMLDKNGKLRLNANEIPKIIQNNDSPCEWQGEHE